MAQEHTAPDTSSKLEVKAILQKKIVVLLKNFILFERISNPLSSICIHLSKKRNGKVRLHLTIREAKTVVHITGLGFLFN